MRRVNDHDKYSSNSSEIDNWEDNDELNRSERMMRIVIHKYSNED